MLVGNLVGTIDGLVAVVGVSLGDLNGLAVVGTLVGAFDGSADGIFDGIFYVLGPVVGTFDRVVIAWTHALWDCPAYTTLQQASCVI